MKGVFLVLIVAIAHYGPSLAYRAAVFEHYTVTSDTPSNTILKNIDEYRQYADKAKSQSVDIMVFPEYGLTGITSDVESYAIEIKDDDAVIKELHNIAVARQIYMVVNILEKEQETNKATKYYNTNLVFNKNGTIILKYRKINLYDEAKLTPGDANQILTFTTDFGVTFGIFTCFDILFDNPSRRVLENNGVADIVYPTAWYSTMPFFTSLTVQHGYSVANGVNLLAANYGKPKDTHGGSGIYLANGKIAEIYIDDSASSKPLIQEVISSKREDKTVCPFVAPRALPTDVDKSNVTNFNTSKDFKASDYKFINVDLNKRNSTIDICHGDFCCTFEITQDPGYIGQADHYKVMAFDGTHSAYDGTKYHVRVCSLLACETDSVDTCGNRLESTYSRFTKLTVSGNLKSEEGTWYIPVTLDANLLPIRSQTYCNNGTDSPYVQLTTTAAQPNVLVFGLFGKTTSSAASIQAFGVLFMLLIAMVKGVVF